MADRRASEREREAAVERLKPRLVDGSLSTDTFSARVERAYAARTKHELSSLFTDLPGWWNRAVDFLTEPFRKEPLAELPLPSATLRTDLTIGRGDDCDFLIDEPTVSRHHAVLRRTPDGWLLRDIGSTNGSRVNGWRIDESIVRPGDELTLGTSRFVVR